jgi:hypothetical protein
MRLFFASIGIIVGAIHGGIIAAIMGGVVVATTGSFLRDEPVRIVEILIGVIGGAIGGGCLAYQGKTEKKYGLGLFTKVALVASGLPLLRLAVQQNHWPTALVFGLLGSLLLLIGCFLILDIVLQIETLVEKMPGLSRLVKRLAARAPLRLITYIPPGMALLLFGAYLIVGVQLTCQRLEPSWVDCLLEQQRWLGLVKVQEISIKGLQEWRSEFGNVVLVTQSGEATIPTQLNTFFLEAGVINAFLTSTEPTLRLSSGPDWFILVPPCLIAGLLFVAGLYPE